MRNNNWPGIEAMEERGVSQLELPEIEYFLGSKVVNHMIKRNEYSYRLWNEVEEMPDEERKILALKYNRQAYLVDKLEHRLKRFMKYCKVQYYRHPREMTYKEWLQNREVDWEKL